MINCISQSLFGVLNMVFLTFFLSGVYRGGYDLLVRSRLALADGVTMQVTVRSKEGTPVDVILASVG